MKKPAHVVEIFLQPGEFYFGDQGTRVRTLLGSCVAITVWHPRLLIGGMCHYVLPTSPRGKPERSMDGRYAEDVVSMFLDQIKRSRTLPAEYQVKMFGGGSQFAGWGTASDPTVPERNIQFGRELLARNGLSLKAHHVGGTGHRNVIFDIWSGNVWMRHVDTAIERFE